MTRPSDPMEALIFDALTDAGERFVHEGGEARGLDFYLPDRDVYIEVKRMHSPRISEQMARAANVIAAQGPAAVQMLATAIRARKDEA